MLAGNAVFGLNVFIIYLFVRAIFKEQNRTDCLLTVSSLSYIHII